MPKHWRWQTLMSASLTQAEKTEKVDKTMSVIILCHWDIVVIEITMIWIKIESLYMTVFASQIMSKTKTLLFFNDGEWIHYGEIDTWEILRWSLMIRTRLYFCQTHYPDPLSFSKMLFFMVRREISSWMKSYSCKVQWYIEDEIFQVWL